MNQDLKDSKVEKSLIEHEKSQVLINYKNLEKEMDNLNNDFINLSSKI